MVQEIKNLHALRTMLDAATGPSQEIDATLAVSFDGMNFGDGMWSTMLVGPNGNFFPVPGYTSSIDAVLALVERLLPGGWVSVVKLGDGTGNAAVSLPVVLRWLDDVDAPTAPLAILKALVAALIAKEKGNE